MIFFRIILLTIIGFAFAQQSHAEQLKYKAEALLDLTAIEYKMLANIGDYSLVGFKTAVSPLILGTVIWDQEGQLVFPRKDSWAPVSQGMVLSDLHRMAPLLDSAKLTAWEQRTADGASLLYCRKDAVSLCFIVDTEVLAQKLGEEKQDILDYVLSKQSQPLYIFSLSILSLIVALLVWFSRQYLFNTHLPIHSEQSVTGVECSDSLKIAALVLNPSKLTVQNEGDIIHVSDKDMKLLTLFAKRPDEVISKEELYVAAWQRPFLSTSRALDQHMMGLRRKINVDLNHPNMIDIIHGQGYRYNSVKS